MDKGTHQEMSDPVNHPSHYTDNPKGIELIDMIGHLSFPKGAAIKYIYRAGKKGTPDKELEDLKKARWFVDHLIQELETKALPTPDTLR
jgi:hypothetical protein